MHEMGERYAAIVRCTVVTTHEDIGYFIPSLLDANKEAYL
jgi:replication-associated recombination protein RarA